jgi:tricorn protease
VAVDGEVVGKGRSIHELLVEKGGRETTLTVRRGRQKARRVVVKALASETLLRYRDWVEGNRLRVKELSGGRAGYIHIPDMQAWGFAEFHRYWRCELDCDGLVIDVRFNRGGSVSQLLLERLTRRRLGYQITRWRAPVAFPHDSPMGPMVCLTNEMSGSDGDIFSHTFKLHRLGPLIGTRTWGGVIGIWPQQALVDGTITTQPEYATWFTDVGYRVENYGTDPDIEVVITPDDYRAGRDPQLERGVEELMKIIAAAEPLVPDFGERPSLAPPRLD